MSSQIKKFELLKLRFNKEGKDDSSPNPENFKFIEKFENKEPLYILENFYSDESIFIFNIY